jgi:hypothetical protein
MAIDNIRHTKNSITRAFTTALAGLALLIPAPKVARAEGSPTLSNNGPESNARPFNVRSLVKELGGRLQLDAYTEVTQGLQADKFIDFINVSTPTAPASGHSRIFANSAAKQIIAEYSDGSTAVLAGSSSGGTITGVTAGTDLTGGGTTGTVTLNVDESKVLTTSSATATYLQLSSATATYLKISSAVVTYPQLVSGLIQNSQIDGSSITKQGNTFNGVSQLVQLNGSTQLPAVSGVNLTLLNASNIGSGTLADGRLSSNVPLLNSTQAWTGGNTFSSVTITNLTASTPVQTDSTKHLITSAIDLSGAQVTGSLPAASIAAGKLGTSVICSSEAVLSVGVAQMNFTGSASASTFARGDGSWTATSAAAGGSDKQIQYNSGSALTGSASMTFDGTTSTITIINTSTFTLSGRQPYFILQSSQTKVVTSSATTIGSFARTGIAITLTPASVLSRFKIMFTGGLNGSNLTLTTPELTIERNAVNLGDASFGMCENDLTGTSPTQFRTNCTISGFMDSPATTSAVTYEVYIKSDGTRTTTICGLSTCFLLVEEYDH